MDATTPRPDLDTMRRELEEARGAMGRAIEEARAKPEILHIFIRANQISADATVRSRRKRNSTSHYAFREIALRADRLRGQWLKDLEKAGRRFMGRPEEGVKAGTPPPAHLIVLDDLGLGGNAGRRESQDLQLLADMSPEEFEALVADPTAPRPRSGPEKRILSLSEIRIDPCVQPRAALLTACVDEYAEAMQRGVNFPPPAVFEDSEKVCWLSDGHHTCAAAIKLKLETIECNVRKGGLRDAILFACGANAAHGLPRSNEDKHRVVRRLLEDPEWGKWSDSEIARRCKVDHKFVAKLREQLRPIDLGISQDSSRTVSRGGTTYTMSIGNIGRSRAPNPASGKGSSEQGPEQPQSALPPQESPELAPEPAPDSAAKLVILDAATDRATPDDVHVLDVDLPTYFGPSRRQLTLDERLGNLIFLTESNIESLVPEMRAAGRLPELFRRVRKLIDKLEAEAAADGDQMEDCAESAAIERTTPTQEELPPSPAAER